MTRETYESISKNAILNFADGLENYCNELAYVVEKSAEEDLIGYTYNTFEKIDSEYLAICRYLLEIFNDNFSMETDGDMFDRATDKLDQIKEEIIDLKYDVMDVFAANSVASN